MENISNKVIRLTSENLDILKYWILFFKLSNVHETFSFQNEINL